MQLRPITRENWRECIELDVRPDQRALVGPNVRSLAEAYARPEATALALHANRAMVGFLMYLRDLKDDHYYIHRLMIAAPYQKQGYGNSAMQAALAAISQQPDRTDRVIVGNEKLFYYPLN